MAPEDNGTEHHFFYTVRRSDRYDNYTMRWGRIVFAGISALMLIILAIASLHNVDAGERAVVFHSDGRLTTLEPGKFQFVMPIFNSVTTYNVQSQLYKETAEGISKDIQVVKTEVAVLYHPDPGHIADIHQQLGEDYANRIVAPSVQDAVKSAVSYWNAEELTASTREQVKQDIAKRITADLLSHNVIVDQVSITDFDFSAEFNAATEAKVVAQQSALQSKNKLEQVKYEAEQAAAKAQGEAAADIARANGTAQATLIQATAQAQAIKLINDQLKGSGTDLGEWTAINRWDTHLPFYYSGGGQGSNSPGFFLPWGIASQQHGNATASG